jgi:hypothetical protein
LIRNIRPTSVAEWKDFILQVDQEAYEWVEWQAYPFAGMVLVPRKSLKVKSWSSNFNAEILRLDSIFRFCYTSPWAASCNGYFSECAILLYPMLRPPFNIIQV